MGEQNQVMISHSVIEEIELGSGLGFDRLRDFLESIGDHESTGLLVIDRRRCIRAANRAVLQLPDSHIESLEPQEGISDPNHPGHILEQCSQDPGEACDLCKMHNSCLALVARNVATKVLDAGEARDFHIQLQVGDREAPVEVALHFKVTPMSFLGEEFAVVLIGDLDRLKEAGRRTKGQDFYGMIGRDPTMLQLFDTIRQVGRIDVPVLIEGESGTGKEMVANALHQESSRRDGRLVPVNCAALSPGLLESELFGHVRGAFTGASRDKKGRFQLADEGSIFLDEIGELSQDMQLKLLRVLQDGTFEPVGSEKTQKVDTRLLCATNRKLEREVAVGRFRADLYYRLCVVLITVPPLRQRKGDIPLLTEYLLNKVADDFGVPVPVLSPDFIAALERHSWPGNVRELDNALRHAVVRGRNGLLLPSHLPAATTTADNARKAYQSRSRKLDSKAISVALSDCNGNKVQAAKSLGISRATLYRYLADLDFLAT